MSIIPAQYRALAALAVVAALCLASALFGALVGGWRASAQHASEMLAMHDTNRSLSADNQALKLAIAEANRGVAVAEAQTRAADQARAQAQAHAEDLAQFSKSRLEKLEAVLKTATGCDEVLDNYWVLRQ